jgi:hypothetical protein
MAKQSTIIYRHLAMYYGGEPITVGRHVKLFANDAYKYCVFKARFVEEHHGSHKYELYGKVVSIKAVFIDKYADYKRHFDNSNDNTFAIYDATYIDGRHDIGNFQDRKVSDIVYYLIVLDNVEVKNTFDSKERIDKCVVGYYADDMWCCGTPLSVGKVADLTVNRNDNLSGRFYFDYSEEHHHSTEYNLRGLVVSIKTIFVDDDNGSYYFYDAKHIDGHKDDADYQGKDPYDADLYIITLSDVVITRNKRDQYTENYDYQVEIDIDPKGTAVFYGSSGDIGDVNGLVIPDWGYVSLPYLHWRKEFAIWIEEFIDHLRDGYARWSDADWMDWWLRGWRLAKFIKAFLPQTITLIYGPRDRCRKVICECYDHSGEWESNEEGFWIEIVTDMTDKRERGIYIENALVDFTYSQTHPLHCKLAANRNDHHLFPTDRVVLYSDITKKYYLATVDKIEDDGIIMSCDKPIDLEQEYSIELVI